MRIRQSGMPEESYWESLFNVPLILDRLGIDGKIGDVIEVGCGYGTFTIPVAQRITGHIIAVDIDPAMIQRTQERATAAGATNVICSQQDIMTLDCNAADGCLLLNILHGEQPQDLLSKAAQLIRPGGCVWAIHWRYDPSTPRGPTMDIRPRPEQITEWTEGTGLLTLGETIDLPPWHFGLRLTRKIPSCPVSQHP